MSNYDQIVEVLPDTYHYRPLKPQTRARLSAYLRIGERPIETDYLNTPALKSGHYEDLDSQTVEEPVSNSKEYSTLATYEKAEDGVTAAGNDDIQGRSAVEVSKDRTPDNRESQSIKDDEYTGYNSVCSVKSKTSQNVTDSIYRSQSGTNSVRYQYYTRTDYERNHGAIYDSEAYTPLTGILYTHLNYRDKDQTERRTCSYAQLKRTESI